MAFTLQRYGLIGARRRSRKGSNTNLPEANSVWSGLMEARREYTFGKLNSEDLNPSPVDMFASWLEYAGEKGISDTTAMSLATADKDGMPTVRTVLL